MVRDFNQGAGQLDPGGPAADDHKVHPGLARHIVVSTLGALEGFDHPRADRKGVGQRLQSRRVRCPVVVAEPVVDSTGGDDEVIKRQPRAVVQHRAACGDVDVHHLGLQDREAPAAHLAAQHMANGRRDRRRGQPGRGHLVEQRLEEVMVGAVEQGHIDLRAGQGAHGFKAAETAADDDDAG